MANRPPRRRAPLVAGLEEVRKALKSAQMVEPPPRTRFPKGRLIRLIALQSARFERQLVEILVAQRFDMWPYGVHTVKEFRQVLIDAYKLLDKEKVTASDWLGRVFEIIGPRLREVQYLERLAVRTVARLVKGGIGLVNGLGKKVVLKKDLNHHMVVRSVKIRTPGQDTGLDFTDRINLISNGNGVRTRDPGSEEFVLAGQAMMVGLECKTRAAAKDIPRQLAQRNERVADAMRTPGAVITFQVEGDPRTFKIGVENLVLPAGEADLFTKIAVVAGWGFRADFPLDAAGRRYIRIRVPVATDAIRRVLEKLLRDRSWQVATP